MAKGAEKKKTNLMLNTAQKQSQDFTTNYLQDTNDERTTARDNATDLYGAMTSGYKDLATNKGISPELLAAIRGKGGSGGGGGGGGYTAANLGGNGVKGSYANFMKGGGVNLAYNNIAMQNLAGLAGSGGWSPADKAAQEKLIAGLTAMGENGGLDAEAMARMRGSGVFDEYAKTGGYTPGQIQDTRARVTSQIPAAYASAKSEADRMGRVTGQYNPAVAAQMARTAGYDTSKAALDAELGISDQVRQGRQWGAGQVASSEGALQQLRTGNMLAGMEGAGGMRGDMLNSIAGNRIGASTGLSQADIGGQGLIQQGKMFGTSGMMGLNQAQNAANASAAASRGASNAANIANEKWLANFGVDNQLAGLSGLGNVYGSVPAELEYYDKMRQGTVNNNTVNTGNMAGLRMQNNPQTDWASTIGNIAGSVIGGATGMGAAGMLGGAAKKAVSSGSQMAGGWGAMMDAFPMGGR